MKTFSENKYMRCAYCDSRYVVKRGSDKYGQRYFCQICKRSFGGYTFKRIKEKEENPIFCARCNSPEVYKKGKDRFDDSQIYHCKSCGRNFGERTKKKLAQ